MSSWIFARVAFYPSLLWGIATESSTKRWYDRIDTHVLLGALPFKSQTKELVENENVRGVVTMNEDYELRYFSNSKEGGIEWEVTDDSKDLRETKNKLEQKQKIQLYQETFSFLDKENSKEWENWGVTQLHLPTVDFNNAPSQEMLRRGVEFIEEMNQNQNSVYVHCKAGRGRSATLATCYVMKTKKLSPMDAHQYIKSKRPHILIASRQWDAIELFYKNLSDQDHCNAT